jgi:hypothetical protein
MRRMRNRILLSGVAALLSAAVVAGPAAASTSYYPKPDPCRINCGPVQYPDHDILDLDVVIKLCLKLFVGL